LLINKFSKLSDTTSKQATSKQATTTQLQLNYNLCFLELEIEDQTRYKKT